MRTVIVISGTLSGVLFIVRTVGIFAQYPHNNLVLILALVLLGFVFLPLAFINRIRNNQKLDAIIDSYKGRYTGGLRLKKDKTPFKGWGMNNSPFKERKSGATWSGHSVHGASVSRNTRRKFLK